MQARSKSKLIIFDLQVLGQHFLNNGHNSVVDITAWAVNSFLGGFCIKTSNMYTKTVKCIFISPSNTATLSGPKLIQYGMKRSGQLSCDLANIKLKLFLEITDATSTRP